jgi:hypothetical protein
VGLAKESGDAGRIAEAQKKLNGIRAEIAQLQAKTPGQAR